ncbi:hypothetical protein SPRG_02762 [Saprolegnia parasitica CBS 223.65]|uniref:Uncharacterized protein n=1 Tax=Saprolegnia parasitica (strain CBS 223.65) TaxID=695850 RepID=A0A067CP72_SAPPC|nr:hypothetical protein SPRG_02762 [Saprolegnia parasitica CBS 223.65]KDO32283.1 hypothetical protein SPRG_02762 [Saprolegnia parasitica CBS 223.65]|eukprot:XP_012196739.1 hypothetical protein SPRG_02762 [Saprolegnia parasitica CBS 223.65]
MFDSMPSSPLHLQLCDEVSSGATLSTLALNVSFSARADLVDNPDKGGNNFANALATGPQLEHLSCEKFNEATLAKIRGLSSLEATDVGRYARNLVTVLSLPRLAVLKITRNSMYDAEVVYLLQHVARLSDLDASKHNVDTKSIIDILSTLNVAGYGLEAIRLQGF